MLEQDQQLTTKVCSGVVRLPECKIRPPPPIGTPQDSLGGSQEALFDPTLDPQTVPSRQSEIDNSTFSGNRKNTLTNSEIRILKSKITLDNNLDGLLALENRIEPGISETIETRLDRDNLIQDPPGTEINLAHLPEKFNYL